jgi:mono/diheme cytochrome c family protein
MRPCNLSYAVESVDTERTTAAELIQHLGAALRQEMASGGPEGAVRVCRDTAPALSGELSRKSGMRVVRVSLKTRNPLLGTPDAWEQQALAEFDRLAAAGVAAQTLERTEIVSEPQGRYLRYIKAIPVQPQCLACHGASESLSAGVQAMLAAEYPHDLAIGYSPGQIRGGVSIKRRLRDGQ